MIHRVLLVDDDSALVCILAAALAEEGFDVATAADGLEGLRRFEACAPDLVILDVLMPELDGLELCRRIRKTATTPVILLTSRAEEVDRINGLELGADDYVTKPFSTRELCARIRAIDRRLAGRSPVPALDGGRLSCGDLVLDPARFEVRWKGCPIVLTRSEFEVLAALVRHRGLVLGRERLLDLTHGADVTITGRTVDTFIKRIRKKLREADPGFDEIGTVFGIGYRYRSS
jgi:DNA-binding response OmpR family regulator